MSLKDILLEDISNVFLNIEDFGEEHTIDGKKIVCVVDDDALKMRQGTNDLSVSESSLLIFAKTEDLPTRKVAGDTVTYDGRIYVVDDWKVNYSMAEIALHQNVSH